MNTSILSRYLEVFPEISDMRANSKVVIGGMAALSLHGLKVRESADLDIVLYRPDSTVITMLESWSGNQTGSRSTITVAGEKELRRSYKIEREGLMVDFLVEDEEDVPHGLLVVQIGIAPIQEFRVQSIDVVIDAKRRYGRPKDYEDFMNFREANF